MTLTPCPACQRHIRTTERSCPFCHASARAPRAGSALVLAAGLTAAAAATGCPSATPLYGAPAPDATTDAPDGALDADGAADADPDVPAMPAYGVPPADAAYGPAPPDAYEDTAPDEGFLPAYGAPPGDGD